MKSWGEESCIPKGFNSDWFILALSHIWVSLLNMVLIVGTHFQYLDGYLRGKVVLKPSLDHQSHLLTATNEFLFSQAQADWTASPAFKLKLEVIWKIENFLCLWFLKVWGSYVYNHSLLIGIDKCPSLQRAVVCKCLHRTDPLNCTNICNSYIFSGGEKDTWNMIHPLLWKSVYLGRINLIKQSWWGSSFATSANSCVDL